MSKAFTKEDAKELKKLTKTVEDHLKKTADTRQKINKLKELRQEHISRSLLGKSFIVKNKNSTALYQLRKVTKYGFSGITVFMSKEEVSYIASDSISFEFITDHTKEVSNKKRDKFLEDALNMQNKILSGKKTKK